MSVCIFPCSPVQCIHVRPYQIYQLQLWILLAPTSFFGDESDSRPSHGKRPATAGTGIRRSGCAANRYSYGYSTATITRVAMVASVSPFPFPLARSFCGCKNEPFSPNFFFFVTYSGMAAMGGRRVCVRAALCPTQGRYFVLVWIGWSSWVWCYVM